MAERRALRFLWLPVGQISIPFYPTDPQVLLDHHLQWGEVGICLHQEEVEAVQAPEVEARSQGEAVQRSSLVLAQRELHWEGEEGQPQKEEEVAH